MTLKKLTHPATTAAPPQRTSPSRAQSNMPKPINLQLGWPSTRLFPTAALHAASTTVLLDPALASAALVYGPDQGHWPLQASLANWLSSFYNPTAGAITGHNLFIGNGASQALGIMLDKFTDPLYTRRMFLVEPTYFMACPIFEDAGFEGRLSGVPEDDQGIDITFLRRALVRDRRDREAEGGKDEERIGGKQVQKYPKLYRYVIYCVPTFSNPSGKVMSLQRREELVKIAREFDALLIADDVYDMLRWPVDEKASVADLPPPPPRLVDLDAAIPGQTEFGNAVSNGSFSKIVAPGCRVNWVQGTAKFAFTLSTQGATKSGGSPGMMTSVFIDQMIRNGSLTRHINEVLVPTYRGRYAVLMEAVEKHLVPLGVKVTKGQAYEHGPDSKHPAVAEAGGFFTFMDLPDDVQPAEKVWEIALECYGLKFAHGGMMLAAEDKGCIERAKDSFGRCARFSWSWLEEDEIREGVERFAQVLQDIKAGTVKPKLESGTAGLEDS